MMISILKSGAEMLALFKDTPEAITNTLEIANRCNVSFEFGHLHLPNFPLPEGMTDEQYLHKLCKEKFIIDMLKLQKKYNKG